MLYILFKGSIEIKVGILLSFLFILLIILYYSLKWVELIRELNNNIENYLHKKNSDNSQSNQSEKPEKMKKL